MSNVQRVCVQCGEGNPVDSRYCARCGYDSQSSLPAPRTSLPVMLGQAALPILVGAATLVMRAGWRLLQSRLTQPVATPNTPPTIVPQTRGKVETPRRPKRSVHIRSSWAVNNGNGVWQQGHSEHTIEFDD